VEVQDDVPGIVGLHLPAADHHHLEAGEIEGAGAALLDPPGQGEVAEVVGRAAALLAARAPAGADRFAVADLVVRAGDGPGRKRIGGRGRHGGHGVPFYGVIAGVIATAARQTSAAAAATQAALPDQTTARRQGKSFSATTKAVRAAPHTT